MYTQNNRVSYFTKPVNTKSEEQVPERYLSLFEVYSLIIGEGQGNNLADLTRQLRSIPVENKDERREHKKKHPHIVFGGEFSHRSIDGLIKPSNLICLDFDHIGTHTEVEDLKDRICEDTELNPVLLFTSPSGDGLKVVVPIEQTISGDEDFKLAYKSLTHYCEHTYQLTPDKSCKDISRSCFLCYDELAVLRDPQGGFDIEKWKPQPEERKPLTGDNRPLRETMNLSSGFLTDFERAEMGVEDIENSGIDITQNYEDWVRIGFALGNLGESGRELFHRVSRFHPEYNREKTDNQFTHSLGEGSVNLETLFAIGNQMGVRFRSTTRPTIPQEPQNRPQQKQTRQVEVAPVQTEFPDLLSPTTEREMIERAKNLPETLVSGYKVKDSTNLTQQLLIPSGKLTGVAGPTGHGKSLILLNVLLNLAKRYPHKRFILFTYEENADTITQYLLNIYLRDLNLTKDTRNEESITTSNRLRLQEGFREDLSNFNKSILNEYELRKNLFFKNYIENGRILIKYVDSDSTTLCNQIRYISDPKHNIGGVLIDYFQYINPDPSKHFPTRQEALKSICIELKDIANETGLPVVLACQFNQEVLSPTDVKLTKIGEAGDISRIFAECWGLWQMGKDIGRELKKTDDDKVKKLQYLSDEINLRDKWEKGMYVRVLKSRFVETGADEMFRFRGLTGKIYSNDTNEKEINSEDWENTNDLPFN